jgi:hypothetical protein
MTSRKQQNLTHLAPAIAALLAPGTCVAQAQDNVFELGKLGDDITVIGQAYDSDLTDSTVTIDDVWKFNRNTLDEAVKLIPASRARSTGRRAATNAGSTCAASAAGKCRSRSTAFASICRPTIASTSAAF